ncbi:MAG: hypothetical protein IJI44_06230 [Erysipelotrichaceae bacterium]|nr:hypothetical protein [Erysipelotrichaceae bacterium]
MLGKLMKYDFKAMFRNLFPIYVALIVLTLVFSLMVKFNFDQGFLFSVFAFLFVAALNGSIVACVFFVVTRFSRGLLKNEGYLSFALPVSTSMHILAKVINAVIWAFIEGLMLCLCMLIMGTVMGSIKEVAEFFREVFQVFGLIEKDMLYAVLKVIVILIMEMIASICLIYAAMAVGHLFSRNQRMIAVAFLIVVCILRSFLLMSVIDLFGHSHITAYLHTDDLVMIIIPAIFAALYSTLTWFILDKRLNLE